jgi:tetratricopeptide (TPR) repeat protein
MKKPLPDLSIHLYREITSIDHKNNDAVVNLALCYKHLNNYDMALKTFDKALHTNPNDYEIYNNLGLLHYDMKKYEESIKDFLKALELKKDGKDL